MAEAVKADYGLDAPGVVKSMFVRAGWTFAFGLAMFLMNRAEYPGPALRILLVLGLIAAGFAAVGWVMVWSSRVAKLAIRDELLDGLDLRGDEKVLDVGCGRGLLAIGAAKRLKTGRVTAIDVWNPADLSGNGVEAAKENAKVEGVSEKVRFETGNARKLVYPDAHFDAVVSTLAIHNIPDRTGRDAAIREMMRVLKPGGRLAVFDILRTGEYAETLRAAGIQDVALSALRFLWCLPSRTLTARK
jgi:arsenite methyltransferase